MSTINPTSEEKITYSKTNPYASKIIERKCLSGPSSSKKTYHVSLRIDSSVEFKPGDSVGIYAENPDEEIHLLLSLLKQKDFSGFVVDLLGRKNLQLITSKALENYKSYLLDTKKTELGLLAQDPEFLKKHDWISLISTFSPESCVEIEQFISLLAPSAPRFYSIASDLSGSAVKLDLLVGTFSYNHHGRLVSGLGSSFLCNHSKVEETEIPFFIHPSRNFSLPDDDTPIIMIGPGTGVAPFRSFLQKRYHQKHKKNWLIFGERNRNSDFYYQEELENLEQEGYLKLSTAFSRDQEIKIYVQDKIKEEADLFYSWLISGAIVYICGDAKQMAKDVQNAICEILQQKENCSLEQSLEIMKSYKKNHKIILEVY